MTRIVFLGTPSAAVPTLRGLAETQDVGLVLTQPDRPVGRSSRPVPPPVKDVALELGLAVRQPTDKAGVTAAIVEEGPFDVGVVVAYGRMIPGAALAATKKGMLNVHFSLLPRWRGAAPVARSIMTGDAMTGVTIILLDEGLDTGPVLNAQAVDILPDEDAGRLTERLSWLGSRLLTETLPRYLEGALVPVEQVDVGATYAPKITAEDRPLDLNRSPVELVSRVRGLSPSPAATLEIDGVVHKVFRIRPTPHILSKGRWSAVGGVPVVGSAAGSFELVELQAPGRTRQSGAEWLRGLRQTEGGVS